MKMGSVEMDPVLQQMSYKSVDVEIQTESGHALLIVVCEHNQEAPA